MSLLAPLGLLLGALAAPLAAMYFLKLRRRRIKVPSTLLWQAFARSERLATPFERFRRSWLLLLQLLLLALLALALARPATEATSPAGRTVVLVVDATASMGATDGRPTRLDTARAEAARVAGNLSPLDEVMVVTVGATAEVAVPFTRDAREAGAALDELRLSEAEGSLRQGLELALSLARTRPGAEVLVFSDGSHEDLSDLPTGGAKVDLIGVGRSPVNAGIMALDLRAAPGSDLERQLFVTVQNFGPDAVDGDLEVFLDGRLVALRTETLPPDEPVSAVFALGGVAAGTLKVTLRAEGDQLPVDDVAWALVEPARSRRVLLVGGDGLTARALAADPRLQVDLAAPADVTREAALSYDAVLLMAPVAADLEGIPLAVLGPYGGSAVQLGEEVRGAAVLGWRRSHPVVRFVAWDPVRIASAHKVTDPGGLVPVVDGLDGPLVLAGERAGTRVVQLTFDPLRSDLPLRVGWPVFLMNTVGWLTEADERGAATLLATGSPYVRRVPDGADVRVDGPGKEPVDHAVLDGVLRIRDTSRVGVYTVRAGSVRGAFAANLVSQRESDIAPVRELRLAEGAVAQVNQAALGKRELWRTFLWLALAFLLLEFGVYHWRRET